MLLRHFLTDSLTPDNFFLQGESVGIANDYLRKYVVEYVAGANLSMMRFWLENDDNLSAEEIAVVANLIRQSKVIPEIILMHQ